LQSVGTALRADDLAGCLVANPGVEPGGVPSHTPAGFVRGDLLGGPQLLLNVRVSGPQPSAGPQHDLGTGAPRQADAEKDAQGSSDFAVRQASVLVEDDDGGLGVGAQLAGSGTDGIARLQRVPTLAALAAATALTAMNIELADDRPPWDFRLVLGNDVRFVQHAATAGAGVGQGSFQNLVNLVGSRRQAMSVSSVLCARLAARSAWLTCRRSFGERSGLTFASSEGRLQLAAEFIAGSLELGASPFQLGDAGTQLLILRE